MIIIIWAVQPCSCNTIEHHSKSCVQGQTGWWEPVQKKAIQPCLPFVTFNWKTERKTEIRENGIFFKVLEVSCSDAEKIKKSWFQNFLCLCDCMYPCIMFYLGITKNFKQLTLHEYANSLRREMLIIVHCDWPICWMPPAVILLDRHGRNPIMMIIGSRNECYLMEYCLKGRC